MKAQKQHVLTWNVVWMGPVHPEPLTGTTGLESEPGSVWCVTLCFTLRDVCKVTLCVRLCWCQRGSVFLHVPVSDSVTKRGKQPPVSFAPQISYTYSWTHTHTHTHAPNLHHYTAVNQTVSQTTAKNSTWLPTNTHMLTWTNTPLGSAVWAFSLLHVCSFWMFSAVLFFFEFWLFTKLHTWLHVVPMEMRDVFILICYIKNLLIWKGRVSFVRGPVGTEWRWQWIMVFIIRLDKKD